MKRYAVMSLFMDIDEESTKANVTHLLILNIFFTNILKKVFFVLKKYLLKFLTLSYKPQKLTNKTLQSDYGHILMSCS